MINNNQMSIDNREMHILLQDSQARELAEEFSMKVLEERERAEVNGKVSYNVLKTHLPSSPLQFAP